MSQLPRIKLGSGVSWSWILLSQPLRATVRDHTNNTSHLLKSWFPDFSLRTHLKRWNTRKDVGKKTWWLEGPSQPKMCTVQLLSSSRNYSCYASSAVAFINILFHWSGGSCINRTCFWMYPHVYSMNLHCCVCLCLFEKEEGKGVWVCVCQRLSNFTRRVFSDACFQPKKSSPSFHHPPPSSPLNLSASWCTNLLYTVSDMFIFDTQDISKILNYQNLIDTLRKAWPRFHMCRNYIIVLSPNLACNSLGFKISTTYCAWFENTSHSGWSLCLT